MQIVSNFALLEDDTESRLLTMPMLKCMVATNPALTDLTLATDVGPRALPPDGDENRNAILIFLKAN